MKIVGLALISALLVVSPALAAIEFSMVELHDRFVVLQVGQVYKENQEEWRIECFLGDKKDARKLVKRSLTNGHCYVQDCKQFAERTFFVRKAHKTKKLHE